MIAEREGILKRIQSEIQHKDKEAEVAAKEMLEIPPEWNTVPDLIMEDEDDMITDAETKRKRDEVAGRRRKWRREDVIRQEKHEHSPMVSGRTGSPAEFYSEDWDEFQQEEDEWQRISQIMFCGRCLEMKPNVSQVPVLNTKEADVAYVKLRHG